MDSYKSFNEKNKFIFLKGGGGTGKTTTLKILKEKFIMSGAKEVSFLKKVRGITKGDIISVLEYKGDKICICSQGDNYWSIVVGLKIADESNCNIFIGAVRGKGKGVNFIQELAEKYSSKICIVKKLSIDDSRFYDYTNQVQADTLIYLYSRV